MSFLMRWRVLRSNFLASSSASCLATVVFAILVEFVCDLLDRVPHACGVERSLVSLIAGFAWFRFPARGTERIFAATTHTVPVVRLELAIVEALGRGHPYPCSHFPRACPGRSIWLSSSYLSPSCTPPAHPRLESFCSCAQHPGDCGTKTMPCDTLPGRSCPNQWRRRRTPFFFAVASPAFPQTFLP